MEHSEYLDAEIERLRREDRFKKIKISYDSTDIMSEFFDK